MPSIKELNVAEHIATSIKNQEVKYHLYQGLRSLFAGEKSFVILSGEYNSDLNNYDNMVALAKFYKIRWQCERLLDCKVFNLHQIADESLVIEVSLKPEYRRALDYVYRVSGNRKIGEHYV